MICRINLPNFQLERTFWGPFLAFWSFSPHHYLGRRHFELQNGDSAETQHDPILHKEHEKGHTTRCVCSLLYKELETTGTIKCIAELDNGWYNVTFNNGNDCEDIAVNGITLHNTFVQCERANIQNSAVIYIKAPFEMTDQVVTSALTMYGTVENIRRQFHQFDSNIETGVRSCLIKNLKKPIPSYIKVGGFSLPVRYRGQQKTCKICAATSHMAR